MPKRRREEEASPEKRKRRKKKKEINFAKIKTYVQKEKLQKFKKRCSKWLENPPLNTEVRIALSRLVSKLML
jgi:ABC-type oligopeptide transport system ATPase subunit